MPGCGSTSTSSAELVNIAHAMTTERDVDKLLGFILAKSRFVTGADAGSIYVVEGEVPTRLLRFKLTQNESVQFDSSEFLMPLNSRSIAGSAALDKKCICIDDVYDLPPGTSFSFDRRFDELTGYRTKSMLVAPLVSQRSDVIGVIQLINRKLHPGERIATPADVERAVVSFDKRSEELLAMLAAQAAACLENALLYDEIRLLFEGFVRASVEAIESRDPTTSGHSRRVADLTVGLARVVDREATGPFRDAFFSRQDLRELEYASLLHDFGKIGVREEVLVKANKLYPHELVLIRARFDYVTRTLEADILARKLRTLERGAGREELAALDAELSDKRLETRARVCGRRRGQRADRRASRGVRAHQGARQRDLHRSPRGGAAAPLARGGDVAQRPAWLADAHRVRRDPVPRRAHVPVPLAHPVGQAVPACLQHRGGPPRTAERLRVPARPTQRGDPAPEQDDGRGGCLRRAHRQRPPLQEGRPGRRARSTSCDSA